MAMYTKVNKNQTWSYKTKNKIIAIRNKHPDGASQSHAHFYSISHLRNHMWASPTVATNNRQSETGISNSRSLKEGK